MNSAKIALMAGSAFAGTSVMLGAFGAHALKNRISTDMLAVYQTGVQYQMYHALALLLLGVLLQRIESSLLAWAVVAMVVGIVLFSGSLYILSLTSIRWVGPVTPLGGLALIIGWVLVVLAVSRSAV